MAPSEDCRRHSTVGGLLVFEESVEFESKPGNQLSPVSTKHNIFAPMQHHVINFVSRPSSHIQKSALASPLSLKPQMHKCTTVGSVVSRFDCCFSTPSALHSQIKTKYHHLLCPQKLDQKCFSLSRRIGLLPDSELTLYHHVPISVDVQQQSAASSTLQVLVGMGPT